MNEKEAEKKPNRTETNIWVVLQIHLAFIARNTEASSNVIHKCCLLNNRNETGIGIKVNRK